MVVFQRTGIGWKQRWVVDYREQRVRRNINRIGTVRSGEWRAKWEGRLVWGGSTVKKCGDNDDDDWSTESFDTISTMVEGGFETRGRELVNDNVQMVTHGEKIGSWIKT